MNNQFKEFLYEKIIEESRNNISKDLESLNNISNQIKEISNIKPVLRNVKEFLKVQSIKRLEIMYPLVKDEIKEFINKIKELIKDTKIPALTNVLGTLESLYKTIEVFYTKTTAISRV